MDKRVRKSLHVGAMFLMLFFFHCRMMKGKPNIVIRRMDDIINSVLNSLLLREAITIKVKIIIINLKTSI